MPPRNRTKGTRGKENASDSSRPAKKKAKRSSDTNGKGRRTVSSKRKDLSKLFDMPLDILLEIISNLDLKGMLNFARASKDLRKAIVNPSTAPYWKAQREAMKAPPPPPGMSEAKWVSFLLSSYCYIRQRSRVPPRASVQPPNGSMPALYTLYSPESPKEEGVEQFVYIDDLSDIKTQWKRFQADIRANEPGSAEAFDAFKRDRIAYVEHLRTASLVSLHKWVAVMKTEKEKQLSKARKKYIEQLSLRFSALGIYEQCDIDEAMTYSHIQDLRVGFPVKLTEKAWQKYRAQFEPDIKHYRDIRHHGIRMQRLYKLGDHFDDWKDSLSLPTQEFLTYPTREELYIHPQVESLKDLDINVDPGDEHYQPIMDIFPEICSDFFSIKKNALRNMVPQEENTEQTADVLELATSIFRPPQSYVDASRSDSCSTADVVVSWKALSVYHYCRSWLTSESTTLSVCQFDPWLSTLASTLVVSCGLNPRTAMVDEMDGLDEHFLCLGCHKSVQDIIPARKRNYEFEVYTWRTALSHAHVKHKSEADIGNPVFVPMRSMPETLRAKVQELVDVVQPVYRRDQNAHTDVWRCNYCYPGYGASPLRFGDLCQHLEDDHGIEEPVIGDDYFLDEHYRKWWERPCKLVCKNGQTHFEEGAPPFKGSRRR
ncbi:hypothetical protein NMY22_g14208 [Coprinellus aureogranulatus]|nr:hypothetical protein NMY22_g14208 [Coprinellus aureogranulatus]